MPEHKIIKECNIEIKKGEKIGLVGPSGSGKSTLINLILGLIKPSSGEISVDNINIQKNLNSWHNQIGYIPQEIYLLDDTITKNITLGLNEDLVDKEKVKNALHAAEIFQFVNSLPDGLETMVGDRGVKLSGGQRQRIGIARALYRNPSIIILDEATNALDNETENKFIKNIFNLGKDKSLLISTHKLSTLKNCDKIYNINNGKIEEIDGNRN